jgi:hypothetical protein
MKRTIAIHLIPLALGLPLVLAASLMRSSSSYEVSRRAAAWRTSRTAAATLAPTAAAPRLEPTRLPKPHEVAGAAQMTQARALVTQLKTAALQRRESLVRAAILWLKKVPTAANEVVASELSRAEHPRISDALTQAREELEP